MAVLTLKSTNTEYQSFPTILKEYASYMFAIKGNSEKTVCEYLLDLRTFFRYTKMVKGGCELSAEEFEKIPISDIGLDDVRAVTPTLIIDYLVYTNLERENNASTRMRKISSIRSFFKYMFAKKHYIDSNPAADIDAPKKKNALPKFLTVEESVKLLQTVKNDITSKTAVRDYAIICLFLNTGMRLSELVGLNLDSFDSELKTVKVLGKGNKERIIYLNRAARDSVIAYLRERLDPKYVRTNETAIFLSGREKRISAKTVQWVVYKYLSLAGLGYKNLSVHKLRHTAATLMYQSGKVDIRVLKDILGHEQLNTTQIYTHLVNRNLEDAVDNNPLADIKIKEEKINSADD